MAVYTHLGAEELARLIAHYDVGELVSAKGIAEGVSNSNWLVETSTGRFILPPRFQSHAGIGEKALFVGKSKRFQIWDPSTYESYAQKARERAKGLTLKLRPGQGGGA